MPNDNAIMLKQRYNTTLDRAEPVLKPLLGSPEKAARFRALLLSAAVEEPKIMQCTPTSIMRSLVQCARLDLEPNNGEHLVYLIPYGQELKAEIGYRGFLRLAQRTGGRVRLHMPEVVYRAEVEAGKFKATRSPFAISHDVDLLLLTAAATQDSELVAAYCMADVDGLRVGKLLLRHEIDERRKKSRSGGNGPWVTHYAAMARKSAVRALYDSGIIPRDADVAKVIEEVDGPPMAEPDDDRDEYVVDPIPPMPDMPDMSDLDGEDA